MSQDREAQRFSFRLPPFMCQPSHVQGDCSLQVDVVGVSQATFNTATFLHRDSGKKKTAEATAASEDASAELFCVTSHVVWRTSQLMASWMVSRAALFAPTTPLLRPATSDNDQRQLRVLELGCGLGLAGLACAKLCVATRRLTSSAAPALVVMTDGDAAALQLLEHNVNLNWREEREGRPHTAQLVWGDRPSMRQLKAMHDGRRFDVVLGADIIYHRTDYEALVDTIHYFLIDEEGDQKRSDNDETITNEDALVIIAMQERQYGALDHLVKRVRARLGLAARVLDVPRMLSEEALAESEGDYIGSNHYMVIFHHPATTLDLSLLGPELAHDEQDDEELLLSLSPP